MTSWHYHCHVWKDNPQIMVIFSGRIQVWVECKSGAAVGVGLQRGCQRKVGSVKRTGLEKFSNGKSNIG